MDAGAILSARTTINKRDADLEDSFLSRILFKESTTRGNISAPQQDIFIHTIGPLIACSIVAYAQTER
jgi:hypothetical protein